MNVDARLSIVCQLHADSLFASFVCRSRQSFAFARAKWRISVEEDQNTKTLQFVVNLHKASEDVSSLRKPDREFSTLERSLKRTEKGYRNR